METAAGSWPFGELLVEKGLITTQELEQALLEQDDPVPQATRPEGEKDELALLAEVAAQDLAIAGLLERLEGPLSGLARQPGIVDGGHAERQTDGRFLVFAPSGGRYVLMERDGPVPSIGSEILFGDPTPVGCLVTKISRSPLPLDRRPCVYLQPLR